MKKGKKPQLMWAIKYPDGKVEIMPCVYTRDDTRRAARYAKATVVRGYFKITGKG